MLSVRTVAGLLTALCLGLSGCHYFGTESQINYGLNHYQMGLYNQAIPPLMSAAKSLEGKNPPNPRLVDVLIALGTMATSEKRNDLAADFYPRALKAAEALHPTDNKRLRNALVSLGMFYAYHERAADAVSLLQRAASISKNFDDQIFHAIDLDNIASAHQNLKQYPDASELQLKALNVVNGLTTGKSLFNTKGTILHNLGVSYDEMGRFKEAEALFKEAIAVLKAGERDVEPWRVERATKSYADLLRRTGREKEAQDMESLPRAPAPQQGAPADAPRPAGSGRG